MYLQGSFAVGDADEHSDVDFIVVTEAEVTDSQLTALQDMHERIYAIDIPWAQHLEGSYFPRERLRHVDRSRSPLLYLDNGASELIRDSHLQHSCRAVVATRTWRRTRRAESEGARRTCICGGSEARALRTMQELADWAPEPTKAGPMSRWKQPYLVLSSCRDAAHLGN
jgi:hypothetical protein